MRGITVIQLAKGVIVICARKGRGLVILILTKVNLPKFLACHLFGEEHSWSHRVWTGMALMVVETMVAHVNVELHIIHYVLEAVGWTLHGAGFHPIAERLSKTANP